MNIEQALRGHIDAGEVVGLSWLVADGDEVATGAIGSLDLDGAEPAAVDTIYRISSLTKPVTAATALLLVGDGVLTLDRPIDDIVPELADRRVLADPRGPLGDTVAADRPITVRDLLTSRLGIGWDFGRFGQQPAMDAAMQLELSGPPAPAAVPSGDEWLRRLATLPLERQPGVRWLYDVSFNLLGIVIERATGLRLGAVLRERVFEPLGLDDTGFGVPPDKLDRFGACFADDPETGERGVYDPVDGQWRGEPGFDEGRGGLVSTVTDYYAFADALRRGALLPTEVVVEMTSNTLTAEQLEASAPTAEGDVGWGFGVGVRVAEAVGYGESIGTYGWDGGLGAIWRTDPHRDIVAVLMANQMWTSSSGPEVAHSFRRAAFS